MTVDVEDWFQVQAYAGAIPRDAWDHLPRRVEANTDRLLDVVRARRGAGDLLHPGLGRRAASGAGAPHRRRRPRAGQPRLRPCPGAHAWARPRSAPMSAAPGGCSRISAGSRVRGYRAPTFSIGPRTPWAWECWPRRGTPTAPASIRSATTCTASRTRRGRRIAAAAAVGSSDDDAAAVRPQRAGLRRRLVPAGALPAVPRRAAPGRRGAGTKGLFYTHPWEIDPGQPHVPQAKRSSRFRHRVNLAATEARLPRLARGFRLGPDGPRVPGVGGMIRFAAARCRRSAPGLGPVRRRTPGGHVLPPRRVAGPDRQGLRPSRPLGAGAAGRRRGRRAAAGRRCARACSATRWFRCRSASMADRSPRPPRRGAHCSPGGRAAARAAAPRRSNCAASIRCRTTGSDDPGGWPVRDGLYVTFRKPIAAERRRQPEGDPAQAARGGAQGDRARPDRGGRPRRRDAAPHLRRERAQPGHPGVPAQMVRSPVGRRSATTATSSIVRDGETPVAAVMNFYWRDEVLPYYGGGTAAARVCHANDFMYWEMMRHAAAAGRPPVRFRAQQGRHRRVLVQEELGVRAAAARLPLPAARRGRRSRSTIR